MSTLKKDSGSGELLKNATSGKMVDECTKCAECVSEAAGWMPNTFSLVVSGVTKTTGGCEAYNGFDSYDTDDVPLAYVNASVTLTRDPDDACKRIHRSAEFSLRLWGGSCVGTEDDTVQACIVHYIEYAGSGRWDVGVLMDIVDAGYDAWGNEVLAIKVGNVSGDPYDCDNYPASRNLDDYSNSEFGQAGSVTISSP